MRKLLLGLAGAFALSMGAAQAQETNIILVSHGQASDAFWSVVKNGAAQAAKDFGVKVDYRAPETFDMVAMSQLIDAAVNQEPDGLIVSIPDADALGPSIKKAVAAGISVISMNSGSDVSKGLGALLHVGQEEYDAGKIAGDAWRLAWVLEGEEVEETGEGVPRRPGNDDVLCRIQPQGRRQASPAILTTTAKSAPVICSFCSPIGGRVRQRVIVLPI